MLLVHQRGGSCIHKHACIICKEATDDRDRVTLTQKGCLSINSASKEREDDISAEPGDIVHQKCRKEYTHSDKIAAQKRTRRTGSSSPVKKKKCLRSVESKIDHSSQSVLSCQSKQVVRNDKIEKRDPIQKDVFQESTKKACDGKKRGERDKWAIEVDRRLAFASDCCAYDVVYHNVCSSNFRSGYGIPQAFSCVKEES